MTQLILDHPENDARILIKGAFERTRGIKKYDEKGRQVVGKTGISLKNYGENIYVDISESPDENQTPIEITAKKEVEINITANAQKYKRRYINELDSIRQKPIEDVYDIIQQDISGGTKEVADESEVNHSPSPVILITIGFMMLLFLGFILIMGMSLIL